MRLSMKIQMPYARPKVSTPRTAPSLLNSEDLTQRFWAAKLELRFHADFGSAGKRTLLTNRHQGPLRIQKALYPEGPDCCHAIVVHPPGGIAGGDLLEIDLNVHADAHAVITTPGAAKWYGSAEGRGAQQQIEMNLCGDLEWLPQESIIFNQARGDSQIRITIAPESRMIGWDTVVLGRKASGEAFESGAFSQSISLSLASALEWEERLCLSGADPAMRSIVGLGSQAALNTIWAVLRERDQWSQEAQNEIRAQCPEIAWSVLSSRLLVGRQSGCGRALQKSRLRALAALRPLVMGRAALPLRIWAT
jgi:urease accessory protein